MKWYIFVRVLKIKFLEAEEGGKSAEAGWGVGTH